jgi:hypothetical protein
MRIHIVKLLPSLIAPLKDKNLTTQRKLYIFPSSFDIVSFVERDKQNMYYMINSIKSRSFKRV